MQSKPILSLLIALSLSACGQATETANDSAQKDTEQSANTAQTAATDADLSFDTSDDMAKISYAMGANAGNFIKRSMPEFEKWEMPINIELVRKGYLDALEGNTELDESQIQGVMLEFQEKMKVKVAEIEQQEAQLQQEANQLFLEEYANKEKVQVTESGIHYLIIEPGTGAKPTATDKVKVHYTGRLVSGDEFDSSYSRNAPAEFPLNRVIPGWTEGLQLIAEGGKIELVLPPELAYGDKALEGIPANSVLIFEVELLEIIKPEAESTAEKQ